MPNAVPDWLTDHSPYPGNGDAFERLHDALRLARISPSAPRVICFAGAGCSMPLLPGWEPLLLGMRDDLRKRVRYLEQRTELDRLPDPGDTDGGYLGFADALKQLVDPRLFSDALKGRLSLPKTEIRFRRTHAAIACMKVDGIVTTNFDLCLSDAQARRFQLDPVWHQCQQGRPYEVGLNSGARERIEAWLKDGWEFSFGGETNSPLYLHGSLLTPGGTVMSATDYGRFYEFGAPAQDNVGAFFLENLAGVASLVFVGYSFSDPFIDTVLTRVAKRPFWRGDHFALLGVEDKQLPDLDARTRQLMNLQITPVYYPVTAPDHPALQELLDTLECYDSTMVDRVSAAAAPVSPDNNTAVMVPPGFVSAFAVITGAIDNAREWNKLPGVDPTQFVERETEMRLLDDLASNVRVRIICVFGLGGTGKTTLLRRVLEDKPLADARFPDGVVVNPIRDDAQAYTIIETLCDTFPPEIALDRDDRVGKLRHAEQVLRRKRMLLVLDGAELLQERPGQPQHGRFLSDDLRSLLLVAAREGQALVAITTRFAPVEFQAYLGASYRTIDLGGFSPGESAAYLRRAGVKGNQNDISEVHRAFQGHPLGLALFAGAIIGGKISALADGNVHAALEFLRSAATLDERLTALLDWYQKDLSPGQMAMLTLLAVYPTSVSRTELLALLRNERVRIGDRPVAEGEGETLLASLQELRLVQFDSDQERYECHAIVRQTMRRRDPDIARAAITSLTGDAPLSADVATIEELQRVVDAIEIAIESLGDFRQANQLLITRLRSGGSFFALGVPQIGVAALARLVSDDPWRDGQTRRQAAEVAIGKRAVGAYLQWIRQFHAWLGNLAEAERYRRIDGDHYIDWSRKPMKDDGQIAFWIDGANYARDRVDRSAIRGVQLETWIRYGGLVSEAIKQRSLFAEDSLLELALRFCDVGAVNSGNPWRELRPILFVQRLQANSPAAVRQELMVVRASISVYTPDVYNTPSGEHQEQHLDLDGNLIQHYNDRVTTAYAHLMFLEIAKVSQRPTATNLFDLTSMLRTRKDREVQALKARAYLCVADDLDRARNGPIAARARSWAAEQLIYAGHAMLALEWSNRALDNCVEDRLERTRGLYMRGRANLALGHFAAAIDDGEDAAEISRDAESPFYLANTLTLRWLAAKHAGDSRTDAWEREKREFCAKVYRKEDYDRLPHFDVLPGEPGFHQEYSRLELADDVLAAVPPEIEILKAIVGGYFEDLRQRYRKEVLKA